MQNLAEHPSDVKRTTLVVAATFLKLELLPQPTFHKRKAELEAKSVPLTAVDAIHVAAAKALICDEFITAEKPGKPPYKVKNLRVHFLPSV